MRVAALLLALLLVTAGCAETGSAPTPTTTATTTTTVEAATRVATSTATAAPTPTDRPTPTTKPTASPTPSPNPTNNPWGTDPVVVAVENEAGYAHEKYDLFREALAYWEANAERYTGFTVNFTLEPRAENPDLVIEYVETVEQCGTDPTEAVVLGCAPRYDGRQFTEPVRVQLRENDDDGQLVTTLQHELGHVLGIGHDEEPMPLMAESNLYALASPWNRSNLTYYLDHSQKPGVTAETLTEDIEPAFDYYEAGADGSFSGPVSFTRVDSASKANVVIAVRADPRGDGSTGSTVERIHEGDVQGTFYRRYTIVTYDLELNRLSWHVAHWLWVGIGEGEPRPTVLQGDECDVRCRSGDWWR